MSKDYLDHTPLRDKDSASEKNAAAAAADREISERADTAGENRDDGQIVATSVAEDSQADNKEGENSPVTLGGDKKVSPSSGERQGDLDGQTSKTHFYIASGAFVIGLVMFILSFVVGQSGTTLLFVSMLVELAGVSFCNSQKRRGDFTACKVVRYACYAVMIAAIVTVLIGISVITSGQNA